MLQFVCCKKVKCPKENLFLLLGRCFLYALHCLGFCFDARWMDGWMDVHFGWLSMEFVGRKRKHQWIPTCPTLHGWYGASGGAYGDNDGVNDDELSDDEEDVDGALVRPGVPKSGVGEARGQIFRWQWWKDIKKKSSNRNITSLLGDNGREKPGYRHSWSPGQVIVIITMRILHCHPTGGWPSPWFSLTSASKSGGWWTLTWKQEGLITWQCITGYQA